MHWKELSEDFRQKWIKYEITSSEESVKFWEEKLLELRERYKGSNNSWEWKHIRAIKKYLKSARADLEYWKLQK